MIGVIILNYNTPNETIECIESIQLTTRCHYKIYVVDNNSTDDSYSILTSIYSDSILVEILSSKINGGYSTGNNVGIKKALKDNAQAIILSNSDIIYFENSIDRMYKFLQDHEEIGIIGPKILLENGEIQKSPRQNYSFKNYLLGKKPFNLLDFTNSNKNIYFSDYKYEQELIFEGLVSGCCIGLTSRYFEQCGELDEGTFLYFEEAIIAHKARENGFLTCVLPNSVVMHKCSLSIGNQNSAFSRYHRYYSSMYMLNEYADVVGWKFVLIYLLNMAPLLGNIHRSEYRKYFFMYIKNCAQFFSFERKKRKMVNL